MNIVRSLRVKSKLSKSIVSDCLGISRPTYDKKENNNLLFTLYETRRLSELFNINYIELGCKIAGAVCPYCNNKIK